jgi:hypothetical protein
MKNSRENMDEFQKIISALLRGKKLRTPFVIDIDESDYRNALSEKLDEYVRRLKNINTSGPINQWIKTNIDQIKSLNSDLLKSL